MGRGCQRGSKSEFSVHQYQAFCNQSLATLVLELIAGVEDFNLVHGGGGGGGGLGGC